MAKQKIHITKAKALSIKPKGRYLLIIGQKGAKQDELVELNEQLKELFGSAKVLAIITRNVNDMKIAELTEEVGKDEK